MTANATIIRAAALHAVPWANGGGVTRVIADQPGAFRLSLATLAQPGPFSLFPGVTRHFALVSGCVELIGRLDAQSPPITFAGDMPVSATPHGPALALNLMVPADAPALRLERLTGVRPIDAIAIFACEPLMIDDTIALDIHDTLLCNGAVRVSGRALAVVR